MHQPAIQDPDAEPEYSEPPDYDSWYSFLASFVFHFMLVLLLGLMSSVIRSQDQLPPIIEGIQVAETSTGDMGEAEDLSAEGPVQETLPEETEPEVSEEVEEISEVQPLEPEAFEEVDDLEIAEEEIGRVKKAVASAAEAASRISRNQKKQSGSNGSSAGGRASRQARWVLNINNSQGNYFEQMGGLGAEIAFPQQGDDYVYFTDLNGARKSSVRSLASESRIFWIDDKTFREIADQLGVRSAPYMAAFLPPEVEERMLQLELAENGKSEDDIAQTIFGCVKRDGKYDVTVISQTLK